MTDHPHPEPPVPSGLVSCRGCSQPVATDARSCPKCGCPRPARGTAHAPLRFAKVGSLPAMAGCGVAIIALLVVWLVAAHLHNAASQDAQMQQSMLSSISAGADLYSATPHSDVLFCQQTEGGDTCAADQRALDNDMHKVRLYGDLETASLVLAIAALLVLGYGWFVGHPRTRHNSQAPPP